MLKRLAIATTMYFLPFYISMMIAMFIIYVL
jgi:hypothetical protein